MKLATSVSTTNLAVAIGVTLVIYAADEIFGFLRRTRIHVTQQLVQRKHAGPYEVGRILDRL